MITGVHPVHREETNKIMTYVGRLRCNALYIRTYPSLSARHRRHVDYKSMNLVRKLKLSV